MDGIDDGNDGVFVDMLDFMDRGTVEHLQNWYRAGFAEQLREWAAPGTFQALAFLGKLEMIKFFRDAIGVSITQLQQEKCFSEACASGELRTAQYFGADPHYNVRNTGELKMATIFSCKAGQVASLAYLHREFGISAVDVIKWNAAYAAANDGRLGIFVYLYEEMDMSDEHVIQLIEAATERPIKNAYMGLISGACYKNHPMTVAFLIMMSRLTPRDLAPLLDIRTNSECLRELATVRYVKNAIEY